MIKPVVPKPRKTRKSLLGRAIEFLKTAWDPTYPLKITGILCFLLCILFICFIGQFPIALQVIPNQITKIRIVAEIPFTYKSEILTEKQEAFIRKKTPPIFSIDKTGFTKFEKNITQLSEGFLNLEKRAAADSKLDKMALLKTVQTELNHGAGAYTNLEDLHILLTKLSAQKRQQIFEEALASLKTILQDGVAEPTVQEQADPGPGLTSLSPIIIEGRKEPTQVQTMTTALRNLNIQLSALNLEWRITRALYRVFNHGIQPNLIYNEAKSEEKVQQVLAQTKPVFVAVQAGETIIEPGSLIEKEALEKLRAYRNFLAHEDQSSYDTYIGFQGKALLSLFIILCGIFYIKIAIPGIARSNRKLLLLGLILLGNLLLIRIILEISDIYALKDPPLILSILPFSAPIAFGPILATVLLGAHPAILISILVSTFYGLMLGSLTHTLVVSLVASFLAIYVVRIIRFRINAINSGLLSGLALALCFLCLESFQEPSWSMVFYYTALSSFMGACAGTLAIAVLPFLEKTFRLTTNITLFELTDYNHPLLKRLQIQAPGTYHHSLVVANLAQRAAEDIGANGLLCRACSLFHDIGKMVKPVYFTENQHEGTDPHLDRNPTMSALIIKSHVKEGVAMAKDYKLPKIIIDVIEQHHGTTLIEYFYNKALIQANKKKQLPEMQDLANGESLPSKPFELTLLEEETVDEMNFRYEGPVPQFKESAIVFFADAVEAASRSLKKISALGIEELVDKIFDSRLRDHQLDESPLSFQEIAKIKKSFAFTLLNTLHARIEYHKKPKARSASELTFQDTPSAPANESNTNT